MKFTLAFMLCIKLAMSGNLLVNSSGQGVNVQGNMVLQAVAENEMQNGANLGS